MSEERTEIEFAGVKFTGGKMFVLISALSTLGGGAWAGFEFYKDYLDMKEQIQNYVAPDLSDYDKRIKVLESKIDESLEIARDIRTDLKKDIGTQSDMIYNMDTRLRVSEKEVRSLMNDTEKQVKNLITNTENRWDDKLTKVDNKMENIEKKFDDKIQKAMDNPLSNMKE
jgi:gas vesicle protein